MEPSVQLTQENNAAGKVPEGITNHAVANFGAALGITLAFMGDRLGLFKAMAFKGAMTSEEIALSCFLNEPVVRDWLINVAAEGYIEYDPESDSFLLPDEKALALNNNKSLLYIAGGFDVVEGMKQADEYIRHDYLNGKGKEIREHHHAVLNGSEYFFRASFMQDKCCGWLGSIPGITEKLRAGIKVADIGCGHGSATLVLAEAFPNSDFIGVEPHAYSVDRGNMKAKEKRIRNVHFTTFSADDFEGNNYDLITFFNCLHEVIDPLAVFKHCLEALKPDGVIMVSELLSGYVTEASFEPLRRMYKGASVLHCLLNGEPDPDMRDVDGRDELEKITQKAGFTHYKRVVDTDYHRILEIRP